MEQGQWLGVKLVRCIEDASIVARARRKPHALGAVQGRAFYPRGAAGAPGAARFECLSDWVLPQGTCLSIVL